jgi:hypothetical protein
MVTICTTCFNTLTLCIRPRRCRQNIPPKGRLTLNGMYGVLVKLSSAKFKENLLNSSGTDTRWRTNRHGVASSRIFFFVYNFSLRKRKNSHDTQYPVWSRNSASRKHKTKVLFLHHGQHSSKNFKNDETRARRNKKIVQISAFVYL